MTGKTFEVTIGRGRNRYIEFDVILTVPRR